MARPIKNTPKILGLDISTRTIGWALFDIQKEELLELTHISPRPKMVKDEDDKLKELLLKSEIFAEKLKQYVNLGVVKVIIEEPLLNSNNVYTIQTLLRFNSFIFKEIYNVLGIVPEFISTYNARKFAWPDLTKENDKGKFVLFGGLPKDVDKKMLIWERVAKKEPQITWHYTKNNTLKKENFDQTDAYTCVLGYMKSKEIWK
jgi:RNase H-fold protein (predicted Holliday junction resolvase)